jgi:hypothetical protein
MGASMRRREFIAGLGFAAAMPLAARAQQPQRMRRVAWLGLGRPDPQSPYVEALRTGLRELLVTYGPNVRELYRSLGRYVDRILRGTPPADLPVEVPTKIELVINVKTAKAIGLDVPIILQQRADEVVE